MDPDSKPTIAILPWGNILEDYLKQVGLSVESFCNDGLHGWLLGYLEALRFAGIKSVLFFFSKNVDKPRRYLHKSTDSKIILLPALKIYRYINSHMINPYGWTINETFGEVNGYRYYLFSILKDIAPYLTTPLRYLAREIRRERSSVILCQEYEYARFDFCVLLSLFLRMPVFATFQGGNFQMSRLERVIRPFTISACSGLIVPTKSEQSRLIKSYEIPSAKLSRIFNPIDTGTWYAEDKRMARTELMIPIEAKVVAWHGRIDLHNKGLDILMQAWKRICFQHANKELRLLLIGTGNDSYKLQEQINRMNLKGVMWKNEFIVNRDTLRKYLNASDIYVFPSRHEGFPVAPLEAMACGLPIVAANAGGILDILEGGESSGGTVVPKEDPISLAAQMSRLLDDESLRTELAKKARHRIESCFSLEVIGRQLRYFLFNKNHTE
ncbi:MAG: glycosyltransferase family 4 protein [Thermodesulfobacteriota bacterium]